MIILKDGDFLDGDEVVKGISVNCAATMNSFASLQLKLAYPKVFDSYKSYCDFHEYAPRAILGAAMPMWVSDKKCIVCMFGQLKEGQDNCYVNYKAFYTSLKKLKVFAKSIKLGVALPWGIGARDGGGDWGVIHNIIGYTFKDYPVSLYKGGDW